jgi:uncharacterized glyoxalase superfamily protein PhnB
MTEPLPRNRSMQAAAVIPVLHYPNVTEAVAWLVGTFGFAERMRIGTHRVQMTTPAGGAIVVAQGPESMKPAGSSVMVRVVDVDAHHETARSHGAEIVRGPETHVYGERQYTARDVGGHVWTFSQSVADVEAAEWGGNVVG